VSTLSLVPMPATEAAIVAALVTNLADLGKVQAIGEEVPTHGRSKADVAALIDDQLILIEAKRTAWQRAIAQAALNRLCCDLAYIALWSGRATDNVLTEARRLGVGVMTVHPHRLDIVMRPSSGTPHREVRQLVIDRLRGAIE
jgi:hypothetical protein